MGNRSGDGRQSPPSLLRQRADSLRTDSDGGEWGGEKSKSDFGYPKSDFDFSPNSQLPTALLHEYYLKTQSTVAGYNSDSHSIAIRSSQFGHFI